MQAKIDASIELLKLMNRLTDKAERKSNEAKKRLEQFGERHDLETRWMVEKVINSHIKI